ncbi:MAG: HAD-IC family P-type ATPase, partial [Oscillospiraceae bacterium]
MEQYKGLTEKEAAKTLVNDGENIINVAKKNSMMKIFAGQFRDAMILILLAATAISALMGETAQAYTIIAIVFLNAVLGFFQEYRTEKTLERLKEMSAPHATVMRDGKVQSIDACNIVREDIVLVKAGDRVPSDCLILQQTDLMTDESMLSGESDSVTKEAANSSAHDKKNMIFMGTMVTKGKGVCRVIATGSSTEMGKIADMLSEIEVQSTPLQKRLSQLSKYIGIGCLIICAIVALSGILRGEDVFQMLLTGISLSVAAVPEGLPAIVTIALALSISRMVKQNALVRRLHAVETLGCANIICSDKTGTLTENKMTVKAISTYDYQVDITGSAQTAIGEFKISGKKADVLQSYSLSMLFDIAVMCNNAAISEKQPKSKNSAATKDTTLEVFGEPTETALLVMAAKAG